MLDGGTMTNRMLLALGFMTGVVGGCASRMEPPSSAFQLEAPVEYQLFTSSAEHHTTLRIETDGKVIRTRAPNPTETGTLSAAELVDVADKIDAAEFPTLDLKYGCGGCADDSVHMITVEVDGVPFTVQADSQSDFPDRLRLLIDTLRAISEQPLDGK